MKQGKNKKQIKVEKDGNLLRINNKWYRFLINGDGDFRTGTHILEEVNKTKRDEEINRITEKLFSFLDGKIVLKDALKDMAEEDLEKLYNYILKHKGKLKPKIKKHCVMMTIGNCEIPIRG